MNWEITLVLLMIGFLAAGAYFGWEWSQRALEDRSEEVGHQEAELQAGWDALHRTQRINAAFWQARQALRAEAQRHANPGSNEPRE